MRFQLPLAILLSFPTVACVTENTSPEDPDEVSAALEKENGGFEMTDEAPAFGADDLYASAAIEADVAAVDPMADDAEIIAMQSNPAVVWHDVTIVWGQMPADPTVTTARDWSGELELSRGGMILRRRIAFEDTTDRVHPRTRRDLIRFDSRTRPHADGLVLRIADPDPTAVEPLRLRYRSADGTRTDEIELRDLANGPRVIDAGNGDRVVIVGRRRNDACDSGFVRGRWHALTPNLGVYLGVVANADGEPVGHLRGIYGQRQNGNAVLYGKFINREGGFRGIFRGTYGDGHFDARWLDRQGDHGQLHGVYFPGQTLRAGNFVGRWAETSCQGN